MGEIPGLLDKLTNITGHDQLCEPRYSRKTKRVIANVRGVDFSIPLKRLNSAIDIVTSLSDGSGLLQSLLDGLLRARQKYGHILDGRKKSRGVQAGREAILYTLKYAAAWTYIIVKQQISEPTEKRLSALRATEKKLESDIPHWNLLTRFEKAVLLTAFLVDAAYGTERRKEGLKKRLQDLEPRDWYRDYIKPRLSDVRQRAQKHPTSFSHLSNAYLRQVFAERNI
jgi:hypothetical protein